MKKAIALIAALLAVSTSAHAQEAENKEIVIPENQISIWDFTLGLGYNYRSFHKAKLFKPNTAYQGGNPYVIVTPDGGNGGNGGEGGNGGIITPGVLPVNDPHWYEEHKHEEEHHHEKTVFAGNADFGIQECYGYELNLALPVYKHDKIRFDAILGFQHYDIDTEIYSGGYHTRYDLSMQTFDIGCKCAYRITKSLDATLTIGPSFNTIEQKSSVNGDKSSTDKLEMGMFAAAGLQYWFCDVVGIAAEIRYDAVFNDVKTRYAKHDLNTWNTDLKVIFCF